MRARRTRTALTYALLAALAAPAGAAAHANLVRLTPFDGSVLARAPHRVLVQFDDAVRPGPRIEAIRNGGGSVLGGRPHVSRASPRTLVIPLRSGLPDGDYSVRWSVISDDGHNELGVLAFAVGEGRAPPGATLAAGGTTSGRDVVSRLLLFAGLLAAAGAAVFAAAVWRPALREAGVAGRAPLRLAPVLLAGFVLAFLGTSGLLRHGTSGTRFGVVMEVAAVVAGGGAAVAAIALRERRLLPAAGVLALALLPLPTLAGHALDSGQPWWSPLTDVVHVAAAAVWLGGLVALAALVPRAARGLDALERGRLYAAAARRFSALAAGAVALVAVTGSVRALRELSSVSQAWETGYGRALVAKTALLGCLVGLGWLNRFRLVPGLTLAAQLNPAGPRAFGRLRRSLLAELALLAGVVAAVAVLTELAPGRNAGASAAFPPRPRAVARQPALLPPPGGVVLARQDVDRAVGLSARRRGPRLELTATVLSPENLGLEGLRVAFRLDGAAPVAANVCGPGCYAASVPSRGRPRTVSVSLRGLPGGRRSLVRFDLPARWPPPRADALLARAGATFRRLRSVTIDERLASAPGNAIRTRFLVAAPNRLSYRIAGGADAVVIGARRWDRVPYGTWRRSVQTPLRLPATLWGAKPRDARLVGADRSTWVVTFLDPSLPAWFEARIDRRTLRPLVVHMTAAAHFMVDRYSAFDRPVQITPPR